MLIQTPKVLLIRRRLWFTMQNLSIIVESTTRILIQIILRKELSKLLPPEAQPGTRTTHHPSIPNQIRIPVHIHIHIQIQIRLQTQIQIRLLDHIHIQIPLLAHDHDPIQSRLQNRPQ